MDSLPVCLVKLLTSMTLTRHFCTLNYRCLPSLSRHVVIPVVRGEARVLPPPSAELPCIGKASGTRGINTHCSPCGLGETTLSVWEIFAHFHVDTEPPRPPSYPLMDLTAWNGSPNVCFFLHANGKRSVQVPMPPLFPKLTLRNQSASPFGSARQPASF